MSKKNFIFQRKASPSTNEVLGWKPPVFHQASECYVSVSCFDPAVGCFRTKKFMLGRIKGKKAQRAYGEQLMKRILERLLEGWNPWVELNQPKEYTLFAEVTTRYRDYLMKMLQDGQIREESVKSYLSRLHIFQEWVATEKRTLTYAYQFSRRMVSDFLEYIYIGRNNSIVTRNSYVIWIKGFSRYMVDRGYLASNPADGFSQVKKRTSAKNRTVIPDNMMKQLHAYLYEKNRHYLLACQILHYIFVRPREMSFLKIGDFSLRNKTVLLHGDHTKNHQDAVVTLPMKVIRLMLELGVFNNPDSHYLFSDDFMPGKERKSEKQFRDFWNNHVRPDLDWPAKYKFYSLKDTGITNMLRANTDILSVRDQARHSSILITDIYTPKDIKKANKLLVRYEGEL